MHPVVDGDFELMTKRSYLPVTSLLAPAVLALLLAHPAWAQEAPTFIPVQGSLTGDDGAPRSGMYAMEFRLYAQEQGGSAFYAETQQVSVDEGVFTAYLGDGAPTDLGNGSTSAALDLATFATRPQGVTFLGITIDEDPEMTPRIQLGSVPFAAFAQTCANATTIAGKPASAFQPKLAGTCPTDQAVVGVGADGSLMCAPSPPGPKGDTGEPGADGRDGQDGKDGENGEPGTDGRDGQDGADGEGAALPRAKWYGADTSASSQINTDQHALCALTRVNIDGDTGASGGTYCNVERNSNGRWTLTAQSSKAGVRVRCSLYCI